MTEIAGRLGNYETLRLLGRSRHTEVYLGQHIHLKTQAAIKIFHGDLSADERATRLARLRRVTALRHPHIARILEFGNEHDRQFLVSEYAVHGSLRQRHMPGEPLPPSTVISYVKSIADALHYAHERGLVHGAIKPENMLVSKDERIVLTDFRALPFPPDDESGLSIEPDQVDAPAYLAPEQWQGRYSPASDQYALAIVVYEWLSGAPPFRGSLTELREQHLYTSPPPLLSAMSPLLRQIEQVLSTALAKDPGERFSSLQAFSLALAQAVGESTPVAENPHSLPAREPTQVSQIEPTRLVPPTIERTFVESTAIQPTIQQPLRRHRLRPLILVPLILLLIGGGFFIFQRGIGSASQTEKLTPAQEATLIAMSPQDRYTFVTGRQPIIDDHLNQAKASQWKNEQKNQGRGSCAFQTVSNTTAYHLSAQINAPPVVCLAGGSNFSNFAFQTSMQDQQNNYVSDAGLVFCSDSTGNNFNLFSISLAGYSFTRYQAGKTNRVTSGNLPFSIFNGEKAHQLTTIAENGQYTFYLDGQALASQTQAKGCSGSIGFFAASLQKGTSNYVFKDAHVWQL